MKKYFALLILFSVFTHSYFVGFIDLKQNNPLVIQENETISFSVIGDIHPVDGDLKQKGHSTIYTLFIALILVVTFSFHRFIQFIKRTSITCPIFFQSNYLIYPPSEN